MPTTKCDSKGRLYLREAVRAKYGQEFVVVEASNELVLLPVPDDPAADLQQLAGALKGCTVKALKERIRQRALREASM